MADLQWENLIVDRTAIPRALTDQEFRDWMARRPIFVSSPMDEEMTPIRHAVRDWIYSWGGEPVMWEEITPQDRHAEVAYLEGVDRSDLVLLALGRRYGIPDSTGYSATHKEANRAKERGITRLLFELAGISSAERDGKLNDWVGELRHEVSGARYTSPEDLVRQLERRVREIASAQERPWLKFGPLVVPGSVQQRSDGGQTSLIATILTKDPVIQRILAELTEFRSQIMVDRLTWGTSTYPVRVENVEGQSASTSSAQYVVTTRLLSDRIESPMHVSLSAGHGQSIGAAEQAEIWGRRAIFGEPLDRDYDGSLDYFTAPDSPSLPQILAANGAQGWLAEGLTRLYVVEGLITKYGGHFEQLSIGPAASSSVRVDLEFRLNDYEQSPVKITGAVPLG
jgi:hypothetical protein